MFNVGNITYQSFREHVVICLPVSSLKTAISKGHTGMTRKTGWRITLQRSSFQGFPGGFYQTNTAAALCVCLLPSLLHSVLQGAAFALSESRLKPLRHSQPGSPPACLVHWEHACVCQQGLQAAPCCLWGAHRQDGAPLGKLSQLWKSLLGQSLHPKVSQGMWYWREAVSFEVRCVVSVISPHQNLLNENLHLDVIFLNLFLLGI